MESVVTMIGADVRRVEQRNWLGTPARVVIAERTYRSEASDVWSALTDPVRIPRWFMPVTGDLRLGGRYQLEGNAGGTINECQPPRKLAVTWEFNGGTGWVNVTLEDLDGGSTKLILEHIAHEDAALIGFWDQFGPGAVGVGWDLSLLGLSEFLAGRDIAKPRDEAAWLATGDGRSFAEASSDAWCEAAIAFGAEPSSARESAKRTTAFYTGGGEGQGAKERT